MMPKQRSQRGFTLLEVLVAFAIAAMALSLLARAFAGGLRLSSTAEDYGRVVILAESLMTQVGTEYKLEDSIIEGRFDDRFNWRLVIAPYLIDNVVLIDSPSVSLMQIDLTVDWPAGLNQRQFHLTSLRIVAAEAQ